MLLTTGRLPRVKAVSLAVVILLVQGKSNVMSTMDNANAKKALVDVNVINVLPTTGEILGRRSAIVSALLVSIRKIYI